ncbi:hypothetical protein O5O45_26190 [Hahella aquimaris]|uniref:hypothetical protein n=1 Tax=Hahella sp. HNIBRBA332 TaxID=3015983 RepID=UPI00273AB552|nr:hypothetical protein [Hahella sp. HNIBRBA332]WLQ13225.1 hypothetical protein O5O45_26190 [Hahella sp. HNIBRBA332]
MNRKSRRRGWIVSAAFCAACVATGSFFFIATDAAKKAVPPAPSHTAAPPAELPPTYMPAPATPADSLKQAVTQEEAPTPLDQEEAYPELPTDIEALASFSASVENGDRRAPPITRRASEKTPDAEILADHEAYARMEAQQHKKVLNNFRSAARDKADELESLIAEGRARGVSPELLQEAEAKRDALLDAIHMINQE